MIHAEELNQSIIRNRLTASPTAQDARRRLSDMIYVGSREPIEELLNQDSSASPDNGAFRAGVDKLISTYSDLMIAILCGRISVDVNEEWKHEIVEVLGNPVVERYYKDRCGLVLPQLLLASVTNMDTRGRIVAAAEAVTDSSLYDSFSAIDRAMETNDDVQRFLDITKSDWFRGSAGLGLLRSLSDPERLGRSMDRPPDSPDVLQWFFVGLTEYGDLLEEYRELLEDSREHIVMNSAFWHKHMSWFGNAQNRIPGRLLEAYLNTMLAVERSNGVFPKVLGDFDPSAIAQLKGHSLDALKGAAANVQFMLNPAWRTPLMVVLYGPGPLGPTGGGGQSMPVLPEIPVDVEFD